MTELTVAIVSGLIAGVFAPIIMTHYDAWRREKTWAAPRKALLKSLLEEQEFRTLKTLTRVTGTDDDSCRTLLIEIGARGATLKDGVEGWTLSKLKNAKPEDFANEPQ